MQDFEGKVAVVTGAASGIGRAIAGRLASEGMRLVLTDIDANDLEKVVAGLVAGGTEAIGIPIDVSSEDAVRTLHSRALEAFGEVDLLCNNAGVFGFHGRPIWEAERSDWDHVLGTNFWGAVHGVRAFLPYFLERGEGYITVTASAAGFMHPRNMYNISKYAVIAYCETVYRQLREMDAPVGFSMLCPGSVATSIFQRQLAREGDTQVPPDSPGLPNAERLSAMAERNAARGVPPGEVADALIEGIRERRFYVFNDREWDDLMRERFEHILNRTYEVAPILDRGTA